MAKKPELYLWLRGAEERINTTALVPLQPLHQLDCSPLFLWRLGLADIDELERNSSAGSGGAFLSLGGWHNSGYERATRHG